MRKKLLNQQQLLSIHHDNKPTRPLPTTRPVLRVSNHVAYLGNPKQGPKPLQLLSMPPFPGHPLPGRKSGYNSKHVTAVSWLKYYFDDILLPVIQSHFNKGLFMCEYLWYDYYKLFRLSSHISNKGLVRLLLYATYIYLDYVGYVRKADVKFVTSLTARVFVVQMESGDSRDSSCGFGGEKLYMRKIGRSEVMKDGARVYVPVSIYESKVSKRFDVIPSGTMCPNADEIRYLQRLVKYKDSAILLLNKPPKLPVKGNLSVHNSMDALAAAALSYDYEDSPKLVHRLDRESSGLLLMGRTKESISHLHWMYSDVKKVKSLSKVWSDACEGMYQKYWALVIGSPKQKEGLIRAPLTKVRLDDGKSERVILANNSGLEASQEAITEYRVLGPTINGCSWIELRPRTSRKHQLRVHCAEALGTPIVGDYKYGWFVHNRWKQTPRLDFEPITGEPYKMQCPEGLDVQKGSVLSNVPLLHLHCREMVLPNVSKFIELHKQMEGLYGKKLEHDSELDIFRFVAPMPSHMKISWNLMSSYLV